MTEKVTRFGVSLPTTLVERFDTLTKELGYKNRSKAIADAMQSFIVERRKHREGEKLVGSISFTYDHHIGDIAKKLTELQHHHGRLIRASIHAHVTASKCVESLIVAGDHKHIKDLYDEITTTRGVLNAKINALALGD